MTTFEIKKAERKGSKVFVQLAGLSDSGKTYSAIQLARGLVGEKGKIGFIDTEQRRASHYADVAGGFDVIDMTAPFSPENYIKATKTFKDAGFDCLIIDSMSHEWDGIGGVLNMAEEQKSSKGYALKGQAKWLKPKLEHKKMMNFLLQSDMHIICCYKCKEPMEEKIVACYVKTVGVSRYLRIVNPGKAIPEIVGRRNAEKIPIIIRIPWSGIQVIRGI